MRAKLGDPRHRRGSSRPVGRSCVRTARESVRGLSAGPDRAAGSAVAPRQLAGPGPRALEVRQLRARVLRDAMPASSARPLRLAMAAVGLSAAAAAAVLSVLHACPAVPTDSFTAVVSPHTASDSRSTSNPSTPRCSTPAPASPPAPLAARRPVQSTPPLRRSPVPDAPGRRSAGQASTHETGSPSDGEMAEYEHAVGAYRLGRFERAGALLHAFAGPHPASSLLDDASFIEAANAGQRQLAGRLAERHMLRFPDSFHRRDAAILVARARRDGDDCVGARAVLAPRRAAPPPDRAISTPLGHCGTSK